MENLFEAFQELELLDEDVFTASPEGLEELKNFADEDDIKTDLELVIDPEAETEEEIEDSYIGKAILECDVCQSKIYKNPEEVIINEDETLANVGEECPYCQSNDGYKVIGQVAEFCPECHEPKVETEDEVEVEIEDKEDLDEAKRTKRPKESGKAIWNKIEDKYLKESGSSLDNADADDKKELAKKNFRKAKDDADSDKDYKLKNDLKEHLFHAKPGKYINTEDDSDYLVIGSNGRVVETSVGEIINDGFGTKVKNTKYLIDSDGNRYIYVYSYDDNSVHTGFPFVFELEEDLDEAKKNLKEEIENITIETDKERINVSSEEKEDSKSEGEMITPVDAEIEDKFQKESDFEDVDIDEFEEEDFDELGEKYLRNIYENVKSFKTTKGAIDGNKLKLEGIITFKSGKQGKTNFLFEARHITKTGKLKFIGENKQFAKGNKTFTLTGSMNGKKLMVESLTYNYKTKDSKGNSKKLYGTVSKAR